VRAELIEVILLLLVIVVPGILKMLGTMREQAGKGGQPGMPRPNQPGRPAQKPLEDEIGEFLRRAAEGRRKPPAAPPVRRAPPAPVAQPVEAEVVPQALGGDIGQHVRKFLDGGEFGRRSTEMGGRGTPADQARGQRAADVFEHEVGQLSGPAEAAASSLAGPSVSPSEAVKSPLLGDLIQALSRPESVRQAVVINEILQRPESRWR
jgi:hypothetical protein